MWNVTFLVVAQSGSIPGSTGEDQARKREMRLLKNREAARECRRKKKEYIKCLENRVAVLENQNKALIDELESLKELYCRKQTEWGLCLLLKWVKDFIVVPILGYVCWGTRVDQQCHHRAIVLEVIGFMLVT